MSQFGFLFEIIVGIRRWSRTVDHRFIVPDSQVKELVQTIVDQLDNGEQNGDDHWVDVERQQTDRCKLSKRDVLSSTQSMSTYQIENERKDHETDPQVDMHSVGEGCSVKIVVESSRHCRNDSVQENIETEDRHRLIH